MADRDSLSRAAHSLAALLALPALALLDGLVALRRGWEPHGFGGLLLPGALALLLAGAAAAALPATRRVLAQRRESCFLLAGAIVLALVLGELAIRPLRIVALDELTHLRQPGTDLIFHPTPDVMPGVEGPARYRVNTLGVRGEEPPLDPRVPRILCVGGSTTECIYLDQEETWPERLEQELRERTGEQVWVGNAGMSGYATPYHIRFVQGSTVPREMDCLVFLTGVNDLLWWLAERPFSAVPLDPAPRVRPMLLATSLGELGQATMQRLRWRSNPTGVEDEAGANYVERRRERREARPFVDVEPTLESYHGYAARLDKLVAACRARGIRAVFLTHPVLWREGLTPGEEGLLWLGRRRGGGFISAGGLRRIMDGYNDLLLGVCRERGAEVCDLRSMNGNARWFYDDCHFNEAGAAEVARLLAEHFVRNELPGR